MYQNKKFLSFLVVVIILLSSILTSASATVIKTKCSKESYSLSIQDIKNNDANWTIMFYLCCENHISYEAEKCVSKLSKIGSSEDLHIVVLKDGDEDGDSVLCYIEKNNPINLNQFYEWPNEVDMSNPNTLFSFIKLVKENYPAKNYAFCLFTDMGSGWQGIYHDTRNPNSGIPLMSIPTFADVFKRTTRNESDKIDVIVLNTCLMNMIEVAYELSPYIDYMVSTEEHMLEELDKGPKYIVQYKQVIQNLKNNTNMTPEEFSISFVENFNPCDFPMWALYAYMIFFKKGQYLPILEKISDFLTKILNSLPNPDFHLVKVKTSLSAIKLDKIVELEKSIDNLASILILNKHDQNVNNAILEARENVREYGKFFPKNRKNSIYYLNFPVEKLGFDSYVDLYNLVYLINRSVYKKSVKNASCQVMLKLKDAVISNGVMPDDPSNGLSIYFPENKELYNRYLWDEKITYKYENLSFSQNTLWDEFLKTYHEV